MGGSVTLGIQTPAGPKPEIVAYSDVTILRVNVRPASRRVEARSHRSRVGGNISFGFARPPSRRAPGPAARPPVLGSLTYFPAPGLAVC